MSPKNDASLVTYAPDVAEARASGKPIVALESTIITHGMPYPGNLEMARAVEAIVREEGATPATIAVIDGVLNVGLSDETLAALATTVAATMIAAAHAGIGVFATGGIGGVHRGAETSFDISADLDELARTGVIVVSAGAKAILDVPKTLEVLETRGVPVVTFGSDVFPAFWSRESGLKSPLRLDTPDAIARFQKVRSAMGITGGMLIANPVPVEDEIARDVMEAHIREAMGRAEKAGVSAKAVTPFLLSELVDITSGKSLQTNIALVKANVRLATRIAVALAA
jgi:pseudouridylate synthase